MKKFIFTFLFSLLGNNLLATPPEHQCALALRGSSVFPQIKESLIEFNQVEYRCHQLWDKNPECHELESYVKEQIAYCDKQTPSYVELLKHLNDRKLERQLSKWRSRQHFKEVMTTPEMKALYKTLGKEAFVMIIKGAEYYMLNY